MKLLADLHVHSRASLDGRSSVEALIETARTRGLSAITVSDHDLCTPLPDCKDLFLIPGVEITSANGHILGLFLDAPIDFAALGKFPPPGAGDCGNPRFRRACRAGRTRLRRRSWHPKRLPVSASTPSKPQTAPRDAKARCK